MCLIRSAPSRGYRWKPNTIPAARTANRVSMVNSRRWPITRCWQPCGSDERSSSPRARAQADRDPCGPPRTACCSPWCAVPPPCGGQRPSCRRTHAPDYTHAVAPANANRRVSLVLRSARWPRLASTEVQRRLAGVQAVACSSPVADSAVPARTLARPTAPLVVGWDLTRSPAAVARLSSRSSRASRS
jgi:hypothetical protein